MERFACPSPDHQGRYRCIDDHVLCDGFIDCPNGEDEDRRACMFYKTVSRTEVLGEKLWPEKETIDKHIQLGKVGEQHGFLISS